MIWLSYADQLKKNMSIESAKSGSILPIHLLLRTTTMCGEISISSRAGEEIPHILPAL